MESLMPFMAGAAPSRSTMSRGGRTMRTMGHVTTEREHDGSALTALPPGSSPGSRHQESRPGVWPACKRDENENGHDEPVRCTWSSQSVNVTTVGGVN